MPSVPHITRIRRRRSKKYNHTPAQRSGLGAVLFMSLAFVGLVIGLTLIYSNATRDLPSPVNLVLLLEPPDGFLLQPTRFYDRSGRHVIARVENPAVSKRQYLPLGNGGEDPEIDEFMPSTMIMATIAVSDPSFLTNPGFSFRGISENSHNTLAQKLVSNLLLYDEPPGGWRAIRERILAAQITHNYGRNQVMEWYLNSSDYGNLAFGVGAAARFYYGKPAAQLSLAEAAVLAAVAESPALNPLASPQTAIQRGKVVLDAMVGQGLIAEDEGALARKTPLSFQISDGVENDMAPAFLNLAWEYLSKTIPIQQLERGGFQIITTLDYDLQIQVSCTLETHVNRLRSQAGLDLEDDPLSDRDVDCPAAQLLPTLTLKNGAILVDLSTEVVILDPHTGEVLAMAVDVQPDGKALLPASHPPGSLATPFIYLTAFTRGFNPASLVWDIPLDLDGGLSEELNPEGEYQGPVRLRDALANDYLAPAAQVVNQIGVENVLRTTRQLGLESLTFQGLPGEPDGCPGCQLILDGGEISLVEVAQAFGVFSNWGSLVGQPLKGSVANDLDPLAPVTILNVQDASQRNWFMDSEIRTRPVISKQLAYLILDILKDEDARWPSLGHPNPLEIGRPAGAKIGTTPDGSDVWTVGFTPQIVVGVWMGVPEAEEPSTVPTKLASALWHAVIQHATQTDPPLSWEIPHGITTMDVCSPSGMLPTLQCPTVVSEVFLTGQEPTQPDTLYQTYQINSETGRLATVFTPPDLIETRTYLTIPPEATTWAESTGLETPPDIYDVIFQPPALPEASIYSPQMFANLKGVVTIEGQASGGGFNAYWLQAGQGLNPSGWTVVQEDTARPVENGILGTWDTTGLNGLYALQLIVLREDQRVDTTTIQVTVDNLSPEVDIPYPEGGAVYTLSDAQTLTLMAQAGDNLGLEAVEFYIDGHLVATQTQSPFAFPWEIEIGKHVFTAKAVDRAGNSSKDSVTFFVD